MREVAINVPKGVGPFCLFETTCKVNSRVVMVTGNIFIFLSALYQHWDLFAQGGMVTKVV